MIPEYEVVLIARENIGLVFPRVRDRLLEALQQNCGEKSIEEVERELHAGTAQLWVGSEKYKLKMVGVTKIACYPGKKRLCIELLQGEDLDGFMHYLELLETWAQQFGATETEIFAREGFRRKLKKIGFEKAYEVLIRPITRGLN